MKAIHSKLQAKLLKQQEKISAHMQNGMKSTHYGYMKPHQFVHMVSNHVLRMREMNMVPKEEFEIFVVESIHTV